MCGFPPCILIPCVAAESLCTSVPNDLICLDDFYTLATAPEPATPSGPLL